MRLEENDNSILPLLESFLTDKLGSGSFLLAAMVFKRALPVSLVWKMKFSYIKHMFNKVITFIVLLN